METPPIPHTPIVPPLPVTKLSWRERFAAILVLLIGVFYLLWLVTDFLSSKSDAYTVKEGAVHISTAELMIHVRSIASAILAFLGGFLLLRGQRAGWVIGVPLLLLLLIIAGGIMTANYQYTDMTSKIAGGAVVFVLFLGLLFLFLPSARLKYKVTKVTFLSALLLLLLLVGLYFFVQ